MSTGVPTHQSSYFSQTLQGADILAKTLGAQVFMPDFLGDGVANLGQSREEIRALFGTLADPPTIAARLAAFAHVLKGEGFKKIGALGYCWGNVCNIKRSNQDY